ncbi:MAG: hypothetical protein JO279_14540 [Verrucomicrobia bacterium]|nr:hypothetical protein [Verrucomicrobiota bacterium]MBV8378211.1 hypothetical protein [Verrucomicrobiota bacterium]
MTSEIIRRFNRETRWVATGVLGVVIFAALLLAVQERPPGATDAVHGGNDLFLNVNGAMVNAVMANSSGGNVIPEPANGFADGFSETSPEENAIAASPAETNHRGAQPDTNSSSPQMSRSPVRVIRSKLHKIRDRFSSVMKTVEVKKRLIALWHQSLVESAKSRSWTAFSSLSGGIRKKAAYTAETNR